MRFTPQVRALDWLVTRPIAHRGLHGKGITENSAEAFAGAIAGGYAIECDLQLTTDDEAVVFHDETLDRLTPVQGWLKEHGAYSLHALSNGLIRTLGEVLSQVRGKVPLVIELKSRWDGNDALARRALKVLERYAGAHCLMSFDPGMIEAVRVLSPRTVRGIVADRVVDDAYLALPLHQRLELRSLSHLPRTAPHFISYHWSGLPYSPLTTYRQDGNPVISWTIRSPEEAAMARRYSDQVTFEGYNA